MRSGQVEANLATLNGIFRLSYLDDLIAAKREGTERALARVEDPGFFRREYERLRADLEEAYAGSLLPERPSAGPALHDLLVRIRLGQV
jgi:hypothetical protein